MSGGVVLGVCRELIAPGCVMRVALPDTYPAGPLARFAADAPNTTPLVIAKLKEAQDILA